jgi:hypothetical protein
VLERRQVQPQPEGPAQGDRRHFTAHTLLKFQCFRQAATL